MNDTISRRWGMRLWVTDENQKPVFLKKTGFSLPSTPPGLALYRMS